MTPESASYTPIEYIQAAQHKMHERQALEAYSICAKGLKDYPDSAHLMCLAAQACLAMGV